MWHMLRRRILPTYSKSTHSNDSTVVFDLLLSMMRIGYYGRRAAAVALLLASLSSAMMFANGELAPVRTAVM